MYSYPKLIENRLYCQRSKVPLHEGTNGMEMIEIATLPAVVEWEMKMNAHNL